ncbi:hypothetical protein COV81_03315 [Candidatus Peregrinibacteria bacterium CG11_big_fil_rev_8_21_14_0_20_41_10]|nr:MAG: hypothetical protein COV81_03315 [Candidatus Peregrinibacteria bacterium CG11_big_fil_rev_8_21_14_0_20_41_10]PIZ75786.1 MAG: hypothetical protein COY06_02590 [Candidatus Peregrinibacteria bacterium CG_4_10_14_0_2_um_filter_41_8]PJC38439.1 MAG: hypothetical protein CO045_00335 [Candidatus Peregrinibacteria bacterium CG_4_9_14_0_2_um_filter_41_14]
MKPLKSKDKSAIIAILLVIVSILLLLLAKNTNMFQGRFYFEAWPSRVELKQAIPALKQAIPYVDPTSKK